VAVKTSARGGVYVDLSEFRNLAINLRAVEPALYKSMALHLRMAGLIVADQAKANASSSSEIAAAIQVRVSGLTVSVGLPPTPIRTLEEYAPGGWQHPVFGNRGNVVVQASYPYLRPALSDKGDAAALEIEKAVTDAIAEAGL
jgi:hypothetical protein